MTNAAGGAQPGEGGADEDPLMTRGVDSAAPSMAATVRIVLVVALSLIYVRQVMIHSQHAEAGHLVPQLSVICLAVLLMVAGEHVFFLSSPRWAESTVRPLALGGFVFAAIILGFSALALDAWSYETVWVSVVGIGLTSAGQLAQLAWRRHNPAE